jgi:uncharacterized protein (DUF2147 family)
MRLVAPVRVFRILALTLAIASGLPIAAHAQNADSITGVWLTEGGKSKVQVTRTRTGFLGRIIWLREPNYVPADRDTYLRDKSESEYRQRLGKPKRDGFNPDESKRTRPILGLAVLNGFKYSGDGVWESGTIYNPEDGKTYNCKMTLQGNRLDVRGFIGISLFGKTTTWTKASG